MLPPKKNETPKPKRAKKATETATPKGGFKLNSGLIPSLREKADVSVEDTLGWESEAAEGERGGERRLSLIVGGGVLLAIAVGIVGMAVRKPADDEIIAPAVSDLENLESRGELAKAAVSSFLNGTTLKERVQFVRFPERVAALMSIHHEKHGMAEMPDGGKLIADTNHRIGNRDGSSIWLVMLASSAPVMDVFAVHEEDGRFLLDWEYHVASNPISLREIQDRPPVATVTLRVQATLVEYYGGGFPNPKEYICLRLTERGREDVVYGYVSKSSRDLRILFAAVMGKKNVPLMLELCRPAFDADPNQFNVTRLVREGWFAEAGD